MFCFDFSVFWLCRGGFCSYIIAWRECWVCRWSSGIWAIGRNPACFYYILINKQLCWCVRKVGLLQAILFSAEFFISILFLEVVGGVVEPLSRRARDYFAPTKVWKSFLIIIGWEKYSWFFLELLFLLFLNCWFYSWFLRLCSSWILITDSSKDFEVVGVCRQGVCIILYRLFLLCSVLDYGFFWCYWFSETNENPLLKSEK